MSKIKVAEIFYSIQGEGRFMGVPSVFLRTFGCNFKCEGFGMPQVEAGACGVPLAATNYSAMEDVLEWLQGYKVNIGVMARELETNAERAYPDNNHLAKIIEKHFSLPENKRIKKSTDVRKATKKRYTWDQCAKVWEDYIDSYEPVDKQGKWDSAPLLYE